MFDILRQVKLKQARIALREGRLDEAFAIASRKDIRNHRGGQSLLEELLEPLLKRAESHLKEARFRDALVDVERAIDAGGMQSRAATLRQEIQAAIGNEKRDGQKVRSLIDSARKHLMNGSLYEGKSRLEAVSGDNSELGPEMVRMHREIESKERKGRQALDRAREHLASEDPLQALKNCSESLEAWGRHDDLLTIFPELTRSALGEAESSFAAGDIGVAAELVERLQQVVGEGIASRRLGEAVSLTRRAARAVRDDDFEEARVLLGRLKKNKTEGSWIAEALDEIDRICSALGALRTGPLGDETSVDTPVTDSRETDETVVAARPPADTVVRGPRAPALAMNRRLVLWVDGVGTYLILPRSRISLGRTGSSARPDIALPSELEGFHAEVSRLEDDYFIAPAQGEVQVNGRTVDRHLLSHGDAIDLGNRCRIKFLLPTPMSSSAVLNLRRGLRVQGGAKDVILFDENIVLGPGERSHVRTRSGGKPIVLMARDGQLTCRAEEPIEVDGVVRGQEVPVTEGSQLRVGELSFTVTASHGGV